MTAALILLLSASTGIPWQKSLDGALAEAQQAHKPVLVDFWAEWCTWCHELDSSTYPDPRVVEAARDFVAVKVNTEGSRAEVKATDRYGIQSLPTIGFLTPTGRLFYRVDGFQKAEAFAETLASVHEMAPDVIASDEALGRNPNDPVALSNLGAHFFHQEMFEESRELLQRALSKDASRPGTERKKTRVLLGMIQTFDHKYEDAQRLLKEAVAVTPPDATQDAAALFALGRTCIKWKKPELARGYLQQAIKTQPDGPIAKTAQAALAELGAK